MGQADWNSLRFISQSAPISVRRGCLSFYKTIDKMNQSKRSVSWPNPFRYRHFRPRSTRLLSRVFPNAKHLPEIRFPADLSRQRHDAFGGPRMKNQPNSRGSPAAHPEGSPYPAKSISASLRLSCLFGRGCAARWDLRVFRGFSMLWKPFSSFFHAMEKFLAIFPRYGKLRGTWR